VNASRRLLPARTRRRILLVDDHPITRYGLVQLLNQEPDLLVCGEAETAQQALAAIDSLRPDLVLADLTLPGESGLDLIKHLQALHPGVAVLVMSMHDENIYAERVLRAGGRGYVMKSEGGENLLAAIRQVLQGEIFVSARVTATVLDGLSRPHAGATMLRPGTLTDREFEVFQLIGQGLSSREIGQRLDLSIKTIGTHRFHIRQKLHLHSGAQLVKEAVRWSAS
jgi:DNA-binding NarL/FixJ family response regulator